MKFKERFDKMDENLEKLELKVDKILDKLENHNARLSRIEVSQQGVIKGALLFITAIISIATKFIMDLNK